jgi:hypothetical protein
MRIIELFTLLAIGFALALIGVDQAFAADQKYYADCAEKNGARHWAPFVAHPSLEVARYKDLWVNGRYKTVKRGIVRTTHELWQDAEKRGACVIATSGPYGITMNADDNQGKIYWVERRF